MLISKMSSLEVNFTKGSAQWHKDLAQDKFCFTTCIEIVTYAQFLPSFDVLRHIKCAKKSLNIFLRKLQINEAAQSSTLQEFSYEFQLDPENLNTSRTFCRRILILHEPRWVLSLFSSQALDILGSRKQVPDKQTSPVIRKVEFQLTRL